MSVEQMWTVIGRGKSENIFRGRLQGDPEGTLKSAGYELTDEERARAENLIFSPDPVSLPPLPGSPGTADAALQQEKNRFLMDQMKRQAKSVEDMMGHIRESIRQTFSDAHMTYRAINWMNWIMFGTGISIFIAAAVYGIVAHEARYSLLFGGLGAATFITQFLTNPIRKTQIALSNMVQTEITIMNYIEQMMILELITQIPQMNPANGMPMPDANNIERASSAIQARAREAVDLLQHYVNADADAKGRHLRSVSQALHSPQGVVGTNVTEGRAQNGTHEFAG